MDMTNLNNLEGLEQPAAPAQTASVEKEAHLKAVKDAMKETIATQGADIVKEFASRSGEIEVLGAACYSDTGNIIEIEAAVGKRYLVESIKGKNGAMVNRIKRGPDGQPIKDPNYKPHKVGPAPKNVGYFIKNNSKKPISYTTTQCELDQATGQYVPKKINAVLEPGKETAIRKGDFTALLSRTEYSFRAANGTLVPKAGSSASDLAIDARLENYTFKFDGQVTINDNQTQIGQKDENGKWHVRPEFIALFGDEENTKTSTRASGAAKEKIDASAYEANFIRKLLAESGYQA